VWLRIGGSLRAPGALHCEVVALMNLGRLAVVALLVAIGCGDDALPETAMGGLRDGEVPMVQPPPSEESCLAEHKLDGSVSELSQCLCGNCLQAVSACDDDEGCAQIYACMQRSGCHDLNECYFERAPCRAVIERWGIMSLALSLAQELDKCAIERSCVTVQESECSVVAEYECDGDEDCRDGKSCCGHFNGATYDGSRCEDSCDPTTRGDAGPAETWTNLCHPGDECPGEGQSCQAYHLLPDFLNRCEDTGSAPMLFGSRARDEVNCGSVVCGKGEKCCARSPKRPYCLAEDQPCECRLPTDAADAGPDSGEDGGADDGGT
jgi:hypothetical protein